MQPPTQVAAVILVAAVPDPTADNPNGGRLDHIGRDCGSVDEALGHLRYALAGLDHWVAASIVPNTTVADLIAADRI